MSFKSLGSCILGLYICAKVLCASAFADGSFSAEEFLHGCVKVYSTAPSRITPEEWKVHAKMVNEHLEDSLFVYMRTALKKEFYDNVGLLLLQHVPFPLVPRPVMLQPFLGVLMGNRSVAERYPLAERIAFLRLVVNTTEPIDRGAYHAVTLGKLKEIGPLYDWIKDNGRFEDLVTQEAIRVLAEVDIAAFLQKVCESQTPYKSDTKEAATNQRLLADQELQTSVRTEQLAGLARLFRLGLDHPEMDCAELWEREPLRESPLRTWEQENCKVRTELAPYFPTTTVDLGTSEWPSKALLDVFSGDAWVTFLKNSNASVKSLMDALLFAKNQSAAQYLATMIIWRIFPDGSHRPNVAPETIQSLARFADTYGRKFRDDKTFLPSCLILYFPFLQERERFETEHQAAWDLYTKILQSDSAGLRCRALFLLSSEVGALSTPEGDMVRKAIVTEIQEAEKDGDLCHLIAASAAAETAGIKKSLAMMAPTVP